MSATLGQIPPGATTVEEVVRHRISVALGGWRGSLEAAAPTAIFVLVWTLTKQLRLALGLAAAFVIVALLARLIIRQTPRFALMSLAGLGFAAVFALRSGRAEDAFLPGILYSCTMLGVSLLSIVLRWPMVGFMLGATQAEDPLAWRKDAGVVRLCQRLTLCFAALFGIRAAIMLPLYLAQEVGWLGVAKIALGWPLYILALLAAGAVLLRGRTPLDRQTDELNVDSSGAAPGAS